MLLSEGMAQAVTQAQQAGRELQLGLQCQKRGQRRLRRATQEQWRAFSGYVGKGIREARAQLGLKLVRNGNGNKSF